METAVILLYHRITESPLDVHGLAVSPAEFRAHMQHLASDYQPLSLEDLANAAREGSLPSRAVAVTFDDGYLDNLEDASPILLELGIPATFFIPSHGLLGKEFWWDALAAVFFGAAPIPERLELQWAGETLSLATATAEQRQHAHQVIYHRVRTASAAARDGLVQQVKQWAGLSSADGIARSMNRIELEALARRPGHSIGGHGTDHLSFPAHTTQVVARDVRENKLLLEAALGRPVTCFAYPFGEHDERSVEVVAGLGYQVAVTCVGDPVRPGMDVLRLPRVEAGSWDVATFDEKLQSVLRGASSPAQVPGASLEVPSGPARPETITWRSQALSYERYPTDKVEYYLELYDPVLSPWADREIKLLELGVDRGGSVLLWRDYFPRGTIVGIDLVIPEGFAPQERIHLYRGDQADRAFLSRVAAETAPEGFDIIIDDASHLAGPTRTTFWHLFDNHLKPGGLYAIEDWGTGYWEDWPDGKSFRSSRSRLRRLWDRVFAGSRLARRAPLKAPLPSHSHGMVGFVKELIDEQGAADRSRKHSRGEAGRQSRFETMQIFPGLVFVRKSRSVDLSRSE